MKNENENENALLIATNLTSICCVYKLNLFYIYKLLRKFQFYNFNLSILSNLYNMLAE